MSKINSLIEDFSTTNLIAFLRASIPSFKPDEDDLDYLFPEDIYDKYESIIKIGEAEIDTDELIVIVSKTNEPLTERTGKKNQYEIAKTILKHEVKDASLFVFYDDKGNFRFSFVKANYLGTKRDFTDFKRYSYFVTPSQANKTFIKQVGGCNFNSLDEIIQAFSVEPLNKQFYQDIAKSFYGLIGGKVKMGSRNVEFDTCLKLPFTSVEENRKTYQEFAVRLIGRTIFCWFLKNKKSDAGKSLLPDSWLSSDAVQEDYYHTILEKLFFLVLNTKISERKDQFFLPDNHIDIPFLNGGLFEPQVEDYFVRQKANYSLEIPDKWFKDLFETLEQYNFTIDENSIHDAEVSIDPEMLGTIFENLLAEIDPDTEKSARKATGSFYTPREIVDYMVEQSLVQYLKTKVATKNEEQLIELFKEGGENKFDQNETIKLLEALSVVKILDPACGSGAFPMGALHKIINALQKLDPDATWWKEKQIAKVPNALAKKMLKDKLDGESADYVRKLGVIQNSIYGVDIQPIASEISKLRSFLSLVIDETIIDNAENRGIQALPNLEFKFVTANTLVGLEEKHQTQGVLNFGQTDGLQDKLKEIRGKYLQAYGEEKNQLKNDFDTIQTKIFNQEIDSGGHNKRALQLASWKPFSNESSSWFDPYWMYGVEKFDVVIGNPPYITYKGKERVDTTKEIIDYYLKKYINSAEYKINSYALFTEFGVDCLSENGVLSYIIPSTILQNEYLKNIRNYLLNNYHIFSIISFENKVFNAVTDSIILNVSSIKKSGQVTKVFRKNNLLFDINDQSKVYEQIVWNDEHNDFVINIKMTKEEENLTEKILKGSSFIEDYLNVYVGIVAKGIKKFLFDKKYDDNHKKYLQGKHIKNYEIKDNHIYINFLKDELHSNNDESVYQQKEKILVRKTGNKLIAVLDKNQFFTDQSIYNLYPKEKEVNLNHITALLNSKLLDFFFNKKMITNADVFPYIKGIHLKRLPIKLDNKFIVSKISKLVDEIIEDQSILNKNISLIDNLIYKLYDLTYLEVKIIDPEFNLTKDEYENYQIN